MELRGRRSYRQLRLEEFRIRHRLPDSTATTLRQDYGIRARRLIPVQERVEEVELGLPVSTAQQEPLRLAVGE